MYDKETDTFYDDAIDLKNNLRDCKLSIWCTGEEDVIEFCLETPEGRDFASKGFKLSKMEFNEYLYGGGTYWTEEILNQIKTIGTLITKLQAIQEDLHCDLADRYHRQGEYKNGTTDLHEDLSKMVVPPGGIEPPFSP